MLELAQFAMNHARNYLANEPGEEVVPSFFVMGADGERSVYITPWRSDEEKAMTVLALGRALRASGAQSYVMVSEAWAITRNSAEEMKASPMPSECDDRVEVITVAGANLEGQTIGGNSLITRVDGLVTATSEPEWQQDKLQAGRMMSLLVEPGEPVH